MVTNPQKAKGDAAERAVAGSKPPRVHVWIRLAAHRCILTPGHVTAHSCFCGVSTDTPAASLPPDATGQGAPSG